MNIHIPSISRTYAAECRNSTQRVYREVPHGEIYCPGIASAKCITPYKATERKRRTIKGYVLGLDRYIASIPGAYRLGGNHSSIFKCQIPHRNGHMASVSCAIGLARNLSGRKSDRAG